MRKLRIFYCRLVLCYKSSLQKPNCKTQLAVRKKNSVIEATVLPFGKWTRDKLGNPPLQTIHIKSNWMAHKTHLLSVVLASLRGPVPFMQDIACNSYHAVLQVLRYRDRERECLPVLWRYLDFVFASSWLTEQVYCSRSYSCALKQRWTFEVEFKLFHAV